MAKWDEQLTFEEVKVGDELPELALPLTVQRLVMEAAANRDFVPLHHDDAAAQRTGAPAMFANTSSLIFGKTTAPIKTCGAKRWSPCLQSNRNQGKGTIQLCRIQ